MGSTRRLLVGFVALLVALLGLVSHAVAHARPSLPVAVGYTYDSQHNAVHLTSSTIERGPPAPPRRHTTHDPDGVRPLGALATPPRYDYGDTSLPARDVGATPTTARHALLADGAFSSFQRTVGAANTVPKALPSGPKITAQWDADTYRHDGLMSTIEHINYRHANNSGFSGVSRYAQGTSARDIKGYVDYVLRNGTVTYRGMVGNVGRTIGYDRAGNPVSGLEIIVRDGMIKTAYPVGVP